MRKRRRTERRGHCKKIVHRFEGSEEVPTRPSGKGGLQARLRSEESNAMVSGPFDYAAEGKGEHLG